MSGSYSRLSQLVQNLAGTTCDLTLGFSYNPAGQITSNTRSHDAYAWTGHGTGTTASPVNGLNQLASFGSTAVTHDANGNLTKDPHTGYTFGYSSENLLTSVNGPGWTGTWSYDPLMRLHSGGVNSGSTIVYDGDTRIAEYDNGGTAFYRHVHGPGIDEPLIEYSGSGATVLRFLYADERGCIIAGTDGSGNVVGINRYDEHGKNDPNNFTRFQFAGMPYETMTELYYSRARFYNQRLPRFMQPDPIGYDDGPNMYTRTKGDPVNLTDPTGLKAKDCTWLNGCGTIGGHWDYVGRTPTSTDSEGNPVVTASMRWVQDPLNRSQLNSLFGIGHLEPGWSLGGGRAERHAPEQAPQSKTRGSKSCNVDPTSTAGAVRKVAGGVANVADTATLTLGVGAIATAPTVVGGVTLGVLAGMARGVSAAASAAEGLAALAEGDYAGAGGALAGFVGGSAGRLASSRLRSVHGINSRYNKIADEAADAATGRAAAAGVCTVAGR